MKKLILFCLLITSCRLMAADTAASSGPAGSTEEKALNQKLIDNSTTAQKYIDESTKNAPPTSIKILTNKGSSFTKTSAANLTDQDKQLSENFVDQAGANKILKEKCVGDMQQACAGNEVDHKVMGINSGLMKAAAQAYASFGAMSDSFLPLSAGGKKPETAKSGETTANKTDGATKTESTAGKADSSVAETHEASVNKLNAEGDAAKAKTEPPKEKPMDYCKYIPAATETIAAVSQKNTVQGLSNGGETSQKEQLLKAAKSHDGRAEQAQIQAVGWYGGAACYAVNAMTGNFATDKNLVIKIAAAAFLGTVYQSEVSANKEYAQKTRDVANALPSKGDCNPITENQCYCATPEYANDPTHCKEQIAARAAGTTFTKIACTDDHLKTDPTCACDKTNSCFDKFLENQGGSALQLGMGFSNSPFKPIASLAKGRLEAGTLNGSAYTATSAIAKRALNEMGSKIAGNNNPLSPNQKAIADAFASQGIPASVSRLMAQNQPPQSALDAGMAKSSGLSYSPYEVASNGPSRVVNFSGGYGLGLGGKKNDKKSGVDDFLGKLGGKGGAANNSKILEFAQRAQAAAPQITKSDRPIFEIISIRYQTSGRRLLQIDSNN